MLAAALLLTVGIPLVWFKGVSTYKQEAERAKELFDAIAPFQQDLQRQIDAAGMQERIVFLGEVPAAEVHLWYQRCLLCVACPRYEPFGLTPFEAAATGCALVCSRTGAFDQLAIPGETGEMVDTGDVEGLTRAVLSVMRDPRHAARMGEAARARVTEYFSLAREAEGIGHVYRALFEKAGV